MQHGSSSRPPIPLLALLLFACGGAGSGGLPEASSPWAEPTDVPRFAVPIEDTPSRGADAPLVTIVMFSDFECPYCVEMHPTFVRLLDRHPGSVRVHFRHLPSPSHPHAQIAAEAAEEARNQAGDAGFWRFHDRLFESEGPLDVETLIAHANAVELDSSAMRAALDDRRHRARVEADLEVADRFGASRTPTLFINGRQTVGAIPFAELGDMLEDEIALAREALGRSIPRDQLYAAVMRDAHDEALPALVERPPSQGGRRRLDRRALYAIPADGAPIRGPRDAIVTIVAFSDFQCRFCGDVNPTIAELRDRYPGQIRYLFRHLPLALHRDAFPAAEAAAEALAQDGDRAFWRMHDRLFEAGPSRLGHEQLIGYARELGLDVDRFTSALNDGRHEEAIEADRAMAARFGLNGTPVFYVNGRLVPGAQDADFFSVAVVDALERANAALSNGADRESLYEVVIADANDGPVWRGDEPVTLDLAIPDSAPRRGSTEPTLVIQEFSDFECPYCGRVQPTVDRLLREHPEIQIAFRHYPLPFHPRGRVASLASLEVRRQLGDEGFWAFHDRLFRSDRLDEASLLEHAREVGAEPAAVREAIAARRDDAVIQADIDAVTEAGVRFGTPAFVIGSRVIMGAQPYEAFEEAVAAAR